MGGREGEIGASTVHIEKGQQHTNANRPLTELYRTTRLNTMRLSISGTYESSFDDLKRLSSGSLIARYILLVGPQGVAISVISQLMNVCSYFLILKLLISLF